MRSRILRHQIRDGDTCEGLLVTILSMEVARHIPGIGFPGTLDFGGYETPVVWQFPRRRFSWKRWLGDTT